LKSRAWRRASKKPQEDAFAFSEKVELMLTLSSMEPWALASWQSKLHWKGGL
jgi:hypothetical protein